MSSFLPTDSRRQYATGQPLVYTSRASGLAPWVNYAQDRGIVKEEIISQCHTGIWPPPLHSNVDVGGEMALKRTISTVTQSGTVDWPNIKGEIGPVQLIGYSVGQIQAEIANRGVLDAFGAHAIAAVLPTNPVSGLSVALGELKKDGLPSLPGSTMRDRTSLARKAGSEYLNIEFGWLPLVNEVKSFARSVRNARLLIDQYRRDSGRRIRRRYVAPPVVDYKVFSGGGLWNGGYVAPNARLSREVSTQFWFSGAFRYHVPVGDDLYDRLRRWEQETNFLFGTRITPEVIWNLAPWSWAVDWFTNAGDVIHNISQLGSDGLVMQYGYAMRHQKVDEKLTSLLARPSGSTGVPYVYGSYRWASETKNRVRANPYGFGIDDVDLSSRQLAILAALGLTKGERWR